MTVKDLIGLLLLNLHNEGLRETVERIWFRFGKVNRFLIFRKELDGPYQEIPMPPDILFKEVSHAQLARFRQGKKCLPSEFFRDKIRRTERSFCAFVSDEMAYIVWVSTISSSGFVSLASDEAEVNYAYCLEPFRGRRLYTLSLLYLMRRLKAEGIHALWIVAHDHNVVGIKSIRRAGFYQMGEIKRWGVISWRVKPTSPRKRLIRFFNR